MEQMKDSPGLLELLPHPGFLVQENIIVRVNASAAAMLLFAIVLTITCINLLFSKKHVHYV